MSFDVDDVGAVCIAHALADLDEAKIIGIVYDSGYPAEGVGAIDSLNWWYGRPEVLETAAPAALPRACPIPPPLTRVEL